MYCFRCIMYGELAVGKRDTQRMACLMQSSFQDG